MFKKGGYLVIYLIIALALCADQQLKVQNNATKLSEKPIVSYTQGKETPSPTQNKSSSPASPHNETNSKSVTPHQSSQKVKEEQNKTFDKAQPKFTQQIRESGKKEQIDPFSKQVIQSTTNTKSMTFNSQQPINQQQNEQSKHQRQIEQQKRKEEEQRQAEDLFSWISEQITAQNNEQQGIVSESFQIMIQAESSFIFRWDPPKSQVLHIKVLVLEYSIEDGSITIMKDNEKSEFIEVSYRNEGHQTFTQLGKVYIERNFKLNFDTDYKYFKLTNNIGKNVMLIVDLEKLNQVVAIQGRVKNDHFSTMASKLIAIDNQVSSGQKLREHSYKYQWGFLENQYTHDSRLLGLTGLELLIIIAAAIVQVYFIKSLLDNRAIV